MFVCVGVDVHACVDPDCHRRSSSITLNLIYWDSLSLNLDLIGWLDWMSSKLMNSPLSISPNTRLSNMLLCVWRSEFESLHLFSRPPTDSANSPTPKGLIFEEHLLTSRGLELPIPTLSCDSSSWGSPCPLLASRRIYSYVHTHIGKHTYIHIKIWKMKSLNKKVEGRLHIDVVHSPQVCTENTFGLSILPWLEQFTELDSCFVLLFWWF